MEGLLDWIMRDILSRVGGADLCFTEFVRVAGTVLPQRTFMKIAPELANGSRTAAGAPVRVQLLGSDPYFMALNAAKLAELGPAGVDLNFGCPAKTVNRHQGGAILLREPERIRAVVSAVRRALPPNMPLTAKMRLGYEDTALALDCAQAIEAGGAEELTVHARTKLQGYRPPAHWDWIARIRLAVRIPVVANGDIRSLEDYRRCREIAGVDDVMIGRGAIANPALARILRDGGGAPLPWREVRGLLRNFWDWHTVHTPPRHRCGRVKQWLSYLRETYPEAALAFQNLRAVVDPDAMERALFAAP